MRTDRVFWFSLTVATDHAAVLVAVEPVVGGEPDGVGEADSALLSPAERRRLARMSPHRAAEFARGRTLLRRLAGEVCGLPPHAVPLRVTGTGKVRLARGRTGVCLSHSARHTVAAVWPDGDLGVDVEEPPEALPPRLVDRCCHRWAAHVACLPERARAEALARVWSVQEACVKAVGRGLSGRPWLIPVDPAAPAGVWSAGPDQDVGWVALDRLAPTALAVAVAVRTSTMDGFTRPQPLDREEEQ